MSRVHTRFQRRRAKQRATAVSGLRVLEHQKQLDQSQYPVYRHRFTVTEQKIGIKVEVSAEPDPYAIPSLLGKVLRHLFLYKSHPKEGEIKVKRFGGGVGDIDLLAKSDFDIVQKVIEAHDAEQGRKARLKEAKQVEVVNE